MSAIGRPIVLSEEDRLRARVAELEEENARLRAGNRRDSLMGIDTKGSLVAWTQPRIQRGSLCPFAIIFFDLDDLKKINSDPNRGHTFVDELLRKMGEVFRTRVRMRDGDLATRWGGDEIVVGLRDPFGAHARAVELANYADEVIAPHSRCSYGVAIHPTDGVTHDEIVHAASVRMQQFKAERKRANHTNGIR